MNKVLMPKYTDNRHTRAIKVALNRFFENKAALNKELAQIISSFSHGCALRDGAQLVSQDLHFFVVKKLLSNHWLCGWFCPSRIALVDANIRYLPNLFLKSRLIRKRINNPFTNAPSVNVRKKGYYMQSITPEGYLPIALFAELYV